MRTRQIKPSFYLDEELAVCSRDARLLFPGLWMIADREGRLEDRPKKIKAQIFPYDDDINAESITRLLDELERGGFVFRYGTNGHSYLFIRTFTRHQHIHHAEQHSEIPEPPEDIKKPRTSTGNAPTLPPPCPTASASTSASASGRDASHPLRARKGARASQKTGCPDEYEPSERLKEWAIKSFPKLRLNEETETFLDYHRAKGNSFANWDSAWKNWIRRAAKFNPQPTLIPMAERLATDEDKRNYSPHGR